METSLGDAASVGIVRDGRPVAGKARAAGPKCTRVHRLVDFALAPGTYTVQLSGSPADTVALLITRVG